MILKQLLAATALGAAAGGPDRTTYWWATQRGSLFPAAAPNLWPGHAIPARFAICLSHSRGKGEVAYPRDTPLSEERGILTFAGGIDPQKKERTTNKL